MFQRLLLIFIIVPILEIYLLITVGGFIGALPTILIIISTAIIGSYLLRAQGIATIQKAQGNLLQGQLPAFELLEGILILIGGVLLLTPGFFTDTIGLIFLIPILRKYIILWWIKKKASGMTPNSQPHQPSTLEGTYRREDD
jgi:UPF0716 protein FxsA